LNSPFVGAKENLFSGMASAVGTSVRSTPPTKPPSTCETVGRSLDFEPCPKVMLLHANKIRNANRHLMFFISVSL
jgi:hypothetical protein